MKNKLILLSMVALLSGCSNNYEHNLTIIAPTGAPSLAFYNFALVSGKGAKTDYYLASAIGLCMTAISFPLAMIVKKVLYGKEK